MEQDNLNKLPQIIMEEREAVLLKSSTPLADVVKGCRSQDVENEGIIDALEDAAKLNMEPPIYRQSARYAIEHGEKEAYFASKTTYEACKIAIEVSISCHRDKFSFSDGMVQDVTQKFSVERIKNVLAYTVQKNDWDGRFSHSNKEWAQSVHTGISEPLGLYLVVDSHPSLLDGFISLFRKEVLERGTNENAVEKTSHKPKERNDDFEL